MVRCGGVPGSGAISGPGSEVIILTGTTSRVPLGTTAGTGEVCPESGVWEVVGINSTTAPIAKGNRMPPFNDKAVTWRLKAYA